MRYTSLLLALLLLAATAGRAYGQDAPRTITFEEAVRIALERNIQIKKAANSVDLQATTVATERADFLPSLNLSSSPSRNYGLQFDQITGRLVSQNSTSVNAGGFTNVNLFNGGADVATLRAAERTLEAEEQGYARSRQDVLFFVIQQYLQVILDAEQVAIRAEDVEAQRQQLEQIEAFVNVGHRPASDVYQQQATLATSELALLEQERALQLSEIRLIQVLELDPLAEFAFEAPRAEDVELAPTAYDLGDLLRRAFQQRPDLRAQAARIAAGEASVRAAKAGYYPSIDLTGRYGTSYSTLSQRFVLGPNGEPVRDPGGNFVTEEVPFGDQLNENRGGSVGFSVSIPVFNRLQTRASVERARVQYENTRLDLDELQQSVALDVRQAYLDYQTAVKRLDVTAKQLAAAEQALRAEQERYNVGSATLVELTQARSAAVEAASNRAQAVYRFLFQNKVIEYHMGTLDPAAPLID